MFLLPLRLEGGDDLPVDLPGRAVRGECDDRGLRCNAGTVAAAGSGAASAGGRNDRDEADRSLRSRLRPGHIRNLLLHHEHRDRLRGTRVGRAFGGDEIDVGVDAVGDEHLAAVEDVVVALEARRGADRRDVGAGIGLGDGDRRDHLSFDRGDEVALAQLVGAELVQRRRRHVRLHRDPHRHPGVVAADDLLEHHRRVRPVEPGAAPLRVVAQSEHPEVAHLLVETFVDPPHLVELAGARRELLVDELAHGLAEELVLGSIVDVAGHGSLLEP